MGTRILLELIMVTEKILPYTIVELFNCEISDSSILILWVLSSAAKSHQKSDAYTNAFSAYSETLPFGYSRKTVPILKDYLKFVLIKNNLEKNVFTPAQIISFKYLNKSETYKEINTSE